MLPRALLLLCLAARLQLPAAVDEALSGFPFSGFDVVLVAGQDNALGAAETPADEATRRADSTAGLPVFGHLFGQRNGGRTDDTASPLTPLHEEYVKTPATGDAYKGNTFAVAFVKASSAAHPLCSPGPLRAYLSSLGSKCLTPRAWPCSLLVAEVY